MYKHFLETLIAPTSFFTPTMKTGGRLALVYQTRKGEWGVLHWHIEGFQIKATGTFKTQRISTHIKLKILYRVSRLP
jgi:hypothetical protein